MIRKVLFLFAIISLIGGCASASFVRIAPKKYPPKPKDYDIPVFTYHQLPEHSYIVIGKVFATKEIFFTEDGAIAWVVEKLKKKAKEAGADAIVEIKLVKAYNTNIGSFVIKGEADAVILIPLKDKPGEKLPPRKKKKKDTLRL